MVAPFVLLTVTPKDAQEDIAIAMVCVFVARRNCSTSDLPIFPINPMAK